MRHRTGGSLPGDEVGYDVVSDASLTCVEVNGLLRFSPAVNTRMKVRTLMVTDMAAGFNENEGSLGRKRRGVLWALAVTGVETALVGAAVIWTLWG